MRTKLGKLQRIQIRSAIFDAWMSGYYKGIAFGSYKVAKKAKEYFEQNLTRDDDMYERWSQKYGDIESQTEKITNKLEKFLTPKVKK